jgi:hypothetical protein
VFHLWLLAGQAWSGRVEYEELLRWALALGLVGALVMLRRHGGSLFGDRRATAIWVLVALLHGPVLAQRAELATEALAETPAVAVEMVCALAGLGLALALATGGDTGLAIGHTSRLVRVRPQPIPALDAHAGFRFLPRPPPGA